MAQAKTGEDTKETENREKGVRVWGQTKMNLESIYCELFPRLITAGCLTSRPTEKAIGLMYVLRTRPNTPLRDYFQLVLIRPLKSQVCQMIN